MDGKLYKDAGMRIQTLRVGRGYTREQLAGLSGISEKFLYEIETGRKGFSADVLHRLAAALCVSCDYILTGSGRDGNLDGRLADTIELFGDESVDKLIRLLEVVYEFEA